jgi:hypothetical protein
MKFPSSERTGDHVHLFMKREKLDQAAISPKVHAVKREKVMYDFSGGRMQYYMYI